MTEISMMEVASLKAMLRPLLLMMKSRLVKQLDHCLLICCCCSTEEHEVSQAIENVILVPFYGLHQIFSCVQCCKYLCRIQAFLIDFGVDPKGLTSNSRFTIAYNQPSWSSIICKITFFKQLVKKVFTAFVKKTMPEMLLITRDLMFMQVSCQSPGHLAD